MIQKPFNYICIRERRKPMKKLTLILAFTFVVATLYSCKSHQRCAAYSKADIETAKEPC